MLRQKTSKQGAPPAPQAKTKRQNDRFRHEKNLSRITNKVDASEENELLEEEATLQE